MFLQHQQLVSSYYVYIVLLIYLVDFSNSDDLLFLDDDAYFTQEDSLEKILNKFSSSKEIAGMAFKIIFKEEREGLQIPFSKLKRYLSKNIYNNESEVSYFIGAGHVLLRETFERLHSSL